MYSTLERAAPATPKKGAASEIAPATGFRKNKGEERDSPGNRVPLDQSPAANGNGRQYCRVVLNNYKHYITIFLVLFLFCFLGVKILIVIFFVTNMNPIGTE